MEQANSQPQIMVAHKTLHVLQRINVEGIHTLTLSPLDLISLFSQFHSKFNI